MKVVAWGFSAPALSEVFAREVARLPGRTDFILQIDPDVRTIDFSSVRIAEFLRMEHTQLESLLRALEKERDCVVVFDAWRYVFSDAFESCIEKLARGATLARRCLFLSPPRLGHVAELPLAPRSRGGSGARDAVAFETWSARTRVLHERVLNAPPHVRLVVSPPPVEAFWGLLGSNALVPAKRLGLSSAPSEARTRPAAFGSYANVAREAVMLLSADQAHRGSPWAEAPRAVDVGWPDGVRAFDCTWSDYVARLAARAGGGSPSSLPAFVSAANRSSLARYFFALAALHAEGRPHDSMPPDLGLLFPSWTPPPAS